MRTSVFDEPGGLTLDELCRALAVPGDWLSERVVAGLIQVQGDAPAHWRFDVLAVRRVRTMRRIERGWDADPELAALVADLEDQIARLRERLARYER